MLGNIINEFFGIFVVSKGVYLWSVGVVYFRLI